MFKIIFFYMQKIRAALASLFIKKFIITTEDLLKSRSKEIKILINEADSKFTVKKTGNTEVDKCFSEWIGVHDVKGQFLTLIKDAYLVSDWAIPVTKDGKVLIETSGKFGILIGNLVYRSKFLWFAELRLLFFLLLLKILSFFNLKLNLNENISDPIFHMVPRHGYSSSDGPAFSHWVHENLPQVRMFYKALEFNLDIKLFVGKIKKDWQNLTLNLLGIKKEQIYESDQAFFTKVSKLYICRLPYIHSREVKFDPEGRLWVTKKVRKSLSQYNNIKKFENQKSEKIVFSRRYCSRRRLVDEDQYLDSLSKKGFKFVYPEKISEIEKIFNSYFAKTILGLPSGSALSNFIFSDKPNLIEIQNKNKLILVWFLISRELNMNYTLYFADFFSKKSDFRDNDLVLNIKNFPIDL